MQEKAHEYKALCIRPTDELTYKREKDHRRLQRLKERNRYSLNNQAGSRAEALAASQPTSWQPYSTLWPAIRLVSRSRPAHSMWRAAVVLYAHDVVRRRLPLNVVVLAHHVHFAQVQKSPQGGHKIFGFREEPITTDARFSRRRATLVRWRLPVFLVYCPDQAPSSRHGERRKLNVAGQVRSLLQDGRRRHRCLCRLGRRGIFGSVVALRSESRAAEHGGRAVPWTRSASLKRPAGVSSARPCRRWD